MNVELLIDCPLGLILKVAGKVSRLCHVFGSNGPN